MCLAGFCQWENLNLAPTVWYVMKYCWNRLYNLLKMSQNIVYEHLASMSSRATLATGDRTQPLVAMRSGLLPSPPAWLDFCFPKTDTPARRHGATEEWLCETWEALHDRHCEAR